MPAPRGSHPTGPHKNQLRPLHLEHIRDCLFGQLRMVMRLGARHHVGWKVRGAAFPADVQSLPRRSGRSTVHRPSFGRGWTFRSYSNAVSPDRSTLRLRDTFRSRATRGGTQPVAVLARKPQPHRSSQWGFRAASEEHNRSQSGGCLPHFWHGRLGRTACCLCGPQSVITPRIPLWVSLSHLRRPSLARPLISIAMR
jgi:hypothetical protein